MRRLGWLVAALLVLTSGAATASTPVFPRPPLAARGVLGAETTLVWSGAKAIRLSVPSKTYYRGGNVDLVVTGATYAFVRLMAPYRPGCPPEYGPRCATNRINWVATLNDRPGLPHSRQHDALMSVPAVIEAPHLDVFLFTDGTARLTIRTTSLRGRTAYRPDARFRGHVGVLPMTCAPLGCGDATGRSNGVAYGGKTYDLQGAGWAEYFVVNRNDDVDSGNQVHSVSGCMFPNYAYPRTSPEARDHPHGCDETSDREAAVNTAAANAKMHVFSAQPTTAWAYNMPWSGAKGRQYIGCQAIGAGPAPSRAVCYGIWFRFLS